MTNAKAKVTSILLVVLLLASSFGTVSVGASTGSGGIAGPAGVAAGNAEETGDTGDDAQTEGDDAQTFHLVQGDDCYEVTALGDGEQNVSEFYGYRFGNQTLYGSYGDGSQAVQQNQVSHVFLYEGTDGLSLVMLHDQLNHSEGGAVSFHVEGLPADREWVVEDDDYPDRDDNFVHGETKSTIHWMWGDNRTDGAAVRGLSSDFEAITIDAEWGEDSWAYENRTDPWPYATDDIEQWQFQLGNGQMISLDKDEPITIAKGNCSDGDHSKSHHSDSNHSKDHHSESKKTDGTLSVSSASVTANESVTFEASGFAKTCGDVTYEWDFDGDGEVDKKTDDPTVSHSYDDEGTYDATVTVVHEDGSEDTSSETIEVKGDDQKPMCGTEDEEDENSAGDESE